MFSEKVYCLHCETVTLFYGSEDDFMYRFFTCSNCGSGGLDVSPVLEEEGFFKQAYPNLQYEHVKVNTYYPLYPDLEG